MRVAGEAIVETPSTEVQRSPPITRLPRRSYDQSATKVAHNARPRIELPPAGPLDWSKSWNRKITLAFTQPHEVESQDTQPAAG